MNKKEERNKKILAIVLVSAVLLLGIYNLFFNKLTIEKEKIDTKTISIVKDNSRFYTVSSCVSKFLNYLSIKDTNNLLILLSEDFKSSNNVTIDNIYSYIGNINGTKNFSARKMYEQRISENIYKYYIHGYIQSESMNFIANKENYYLIVILDEETMTFAIEPYDGSMFK